MTVQLDILFLDIDGVISSDKDKSATTFSHACVAQHKRFFAACPQTKIVFSTS